MSSLSQNYDISLTENNESKETELVEVNSKNSTAKDSGYSHLNNVENETISTEYAENSDNNDDFTDLKEHFNNSIIINKPLVNEPEKKIKYRKGNLHTFFYDCNGIPKIVIGPDCKFFYIIKTFINRGISIMHANIHFFYNHFILYRII